MTVKTLIKLMGKQRKRKVCWWREKEREGDNEGPPLEGRVCAVFRPCAASKRVWARAANDSSWRSPSTHTQMLTVNESTENTLSHHPNEKMARMEVERKVFFILFFYPPSGIEIAHIYSGWAKQHWSGHWVKVQPGSELQQLGKCTQQCWCTSL